MKATLFISLLLVRALYAYAQKPDTVEIHFRLNETKLNKEALETIGQFISKDKLIRGEQLIVLGYADYLGGNEYNEVLSKERAKSVKNYLVAAGFGDKEITLCTGKGKIERAGVSGNEGYANDRKVQIIVKKNKPARQAPPTALPATVEKNMLRMKANETMALKDILFEGGTDELLSQSYPELEKLAAFLLSHNSVKIQIEGHICCMMDPNATDDMGPDGHSPLSERRAKRIYLYLASKGVYAGRMKVVGLGNTKPLISPEVTDADREANRRVEIRILSK